MTVSTSDQNVDYKGYIRLFHLHEIVGKAIEKVVVPGKSDYHGMSAVFFLDKTFIVFDANFEVRLWDKDIFDEVLYTFGFISKEQLEERKEQDLARRKAVREAREFEEYKKAVKKFGPLTNLD